TDNTAGDSRRSGRLRAGVRGVARLADLYQGLRELGRATAPGARVPQPPRRAAGDAAGTGLGGARARPDDPSAPAGGVTKVRPEAAGLLAQTSPPGPSPGRRGAGR